MESDSIYPEVIADRYELRELISHGGMGAVFRCVDRMIGSDCAIKLLSMEEILSRKGRERFEQECQMLLHFDHPNVIHNLDYGIYADIPYLVMELCVDKQGRPFTLRQLQQQYPDQRLPWDDLKDIFAQFLKGLALFHQHGLVHRDIKPENVLLHTTKDGRLIPKLIDFGLVTISCDSDMGQRMQLSSPVEQQPLDSAVITGTLKFMSPEQLDGTPVSATSDVYSMGVTLFHLLTAKEHPNVAPHAWDELALPEWLTKLLEASLKDEASERPKDASAMLEYLPEDILTMASTHEELDRDAPTKHQIKLSANTIILGDPIQGRFQVLEETGHQEGITWFTCRDLTSGKMLTIRLRPYDRDRDQDAVIEFDQRCRELMLVPHPNLIEIIECGVDSALGQTYLVTELIPDGEHGPTTLGDLVRSKADGRLNWREVCHFAPQISNALAKLHGNGITHGQLSPRNVLITKNDEGVPQAKLMGFADCEVFTPEFIRYLPPFSGRKSIFGKPGEEEGLVGDYDFMSPEQRKGAPYDPQTDAYSMGRTLYYMATGYERLSVSKPTEVNPELPGWVDDLCEHCLETDRDRRIESLLLAEHLIPEELRGGNQSLLEDDGEQTEQDPIEAATPDVAPSNPLIINDLVPQETDSVKALETMETRVDLEAMETMKTQIDTEPHMEDLKVSRIKPEISEIKEDIANTLSISLEKPVEEPKVPKAIPRTLEITRPPPARTVPKAVAVLEKDMSTALVPTRNNPEPIQFKGRHRRRSKFKQLRRRYKRFIPAMVIAIGITMALMVCLFGYGLFIVLVGNGNGGVRDTFRFNIQKAEGQLQKRNFTAAMRYAKDAQKCAKKNEDEKEKASQLLERIQKRLKEQKESPSTNRPPHDGTQNNGIRGENKNAAVPTASEKSFHCSKETSRSTVL